MIPLLFIAAFLGGLLTLLAPCSALLLPAFFAYSFANRTALIRATLLFLVGLYAVLLPLGLAASLAGRLFVEQRQTTIVIAGAVLVGLGALLLLGRGFSLVPGRVKNPARGAATLMTGVVYGLTGLCSGPLLGGVLTIAAAGASPVLGAVLLMVYAVGMAVPLLLLAAAWNRFELGRRLWLRASVRRMNFVGGALFVALGALFIATQGGLVLSGAYDDLGLGNLSSQWQSWLTNTLT